ncbi:hypothetical protein [Bradyrhizobium neotropicale]|uniref:hypothetical protein n=1 Tax=Bradyrhizobium neotropicale TaxID=1497615 RepID=UPI001AD770D8|nr:hypothetical protein [Bradyrhizobium neotropicale]
MIEIAGLVTEMDVDQAFGRDVAIKAPPASGLNTAMARRRLGCGQVAHSGSLARRNVMRLRGASGEAGEGVDTTTIDGREIRVQALISGRNRSLSGAAEAGEDVGARIIVHGKRIARTREYSAMKRFASSRCS